LKDLAILLPRAKVARDVLPNQLRDLGARIDVVEAYQTIIPKDSGPLLRAALAERHVDGITFTSSSTVSNLAALLDTDDLSPPLPLRSPPFCLLPVTPSRHTPPQNFTSPPMLCPTTIRFPRWSTRSLRI